MKEPEPDPDAWLVRAKCKGLPVSMFVPSVPGGSLDRALAVCHGWDGFPPCPVRPECGRAGADHDEFGVWGGNIRSQRGIRVVDPIITIVDMRPRSH